MSDWTHDNLLNDLANSRENPRTMVWRDMQLGPSGSRRPDVFTMAKSYTTPAPTAYEVKVTRSDFRSDVTSGKYIEYLRFAECVVFAVPDGLIAPKEIPDGCGLIVRKKEVWRYVRKPVRKSVTPPRSFWMKLVLDGASAYPPPPCRRADDYRRALRERKGLGDAVAAAILDLEGAQNRVRLAAAECERLQQAKADALNEIKQIERAAKERGEAAAQKKIDAADEYLRQCARATGLREDQARHDIMAPLYRRRAQEISQDAEVKRLRAQLDAIRSALATADDSAVRRLCESEAA